MTLARQFQSTPDDLLSSGSVVEGRTKIKVDFAPVWRKYEAAKQAANDALDAAGVSAWYRVPKSHPARKAWEKEVAKAEAELLTGLEAEAKRAGWKPGVANESLDEATATPLYRKLLALRSQFASAAQKVYDAWEQDEEGMDDEYGGGGICQDIADEMAGVVNRRLRGADAHIVDNNGMGDQHVWIIVVQGDEKYAVDIPPGTYETGGGYTWKKIDGVRFNANHVDVYAVPDFEPDQYESVDEAVGAVKKLLLTHQVVHLGAVGRFDVHVAEPLLGSKPFTKPLSVPEYAKLSKAGDALLSPVVDARDIEKNIKIADDRLTAVGIPRQRTTLIVMPITNRNYITGGTTGGWWDRKGHAITVSTSELSTPDTLSRIIAHEWGHDVWGRLPKEKKAEFAQWFARNVGQAATDYARKNQPKISKASKDEVESFVADFWAYGATLYHTRSLKALINAVRGNRELIDQNPKSELRSEYEQDYRTAQDKLEEDAFSKSPRAVLLSSNFDSVWEKMVRSRLSSWWFHEYESLAGRPVMPDNITDMVAYAKKQWRKHVDEHGKHEDLVGFDIEKWAGVVCQNVILSFEASPTVGSDQLSAPAGEDIRLGLKYAGITPTAYAAADDRELWAEMIDLVVNNPDDKRFKTLWKLMQKLVHESTSTTLAGLFESKPINLKTGRDGQDPESVLRTVKAGQLVTFDGAKDFWTVEKVRKQIRKDSIPHDTDPTGPSKDVRYLVVTVTSINSWLQRRNDTFGGTDYAHRTKSFMQEGVESTPPTKGKQIIKIGKYGRFTGYSSSEGKPGMYTKQGDLKDTLLDNPAIDIPTFLKKVNSAMDDLSMPNHEADVVFANYPHGKDVSGWMYPSIKSTVFLNRTLSSTAMSKYAAWKGPRSPHTLVHEYAHDVWYQVLSPKQRDAVNDYYQKNVVPNKTGAVQKLISPTDYGTTKVEEWWAEIVAYSIHKGRVAQEVLDFLVDVMKKKLDTAPAAAKAAPEKTIVATPAPAEPPETPVGKLIKQGDAEIKKEIGDYTLDPRADGSVRVIPVNKGKAHDGGVMAKLAMALGFNRHGKSPFKVRLSTGSQGGIVLFPESVSETAIRSMLSEIEDSEPLDYIDEKGLATTVLGLVGIRHGRRKILTHVDTLSPGDELEVRRAEDPDTRTYWLHFRRTEDGMELLGADGATITALNRQKDMLGYVRELIRNGAKVRHVKK
jgi:hypothetical protein